MDARRPPAVLRVEDHDDTRRMLTLLLQSDGWNVTAVSTVDAALRALADHHFEVLLSDIGLPDGTGWDLLEKASPSSYSRAQAMSGFDRPEDRSRSAAVGFHHHLRKPFDPEDLLSLLTPAQTPRAGSAKGC